MAKFADKNFTRLVQGTHIFEGHRLKMYNCSSLTKLADFLKAANALVHAVSSQRARDRHIPSQWSAGLQGMSVKP